ncbi:MAG: enoyl-CoA hydratase/isomerase family protein [Candidatus Methylomirabilia bacterium]
MLYQTIRYAVQEGVATITLNRPEVHNAINALMLQEIQAAVGELQADPAVRVAVVDSASPRAFSAGIDVAFVKDLSPLESREVGRLLHETFGAIRFANKPFITAIDGLCLGAGLELAISCDLLIATDRSRFGLPNINVGIPAIVEAAILPQAVGIVGTKELCYTGEFWDAAKAERRGLLNAVVPPERLREEVRTWALRIAAKSPWALATQKEIINQWMTAPLESAIDFSINTVVLNWLTRDQKEGMGAFLEKRQARFTGE